MKPLAPSRSVAIPTAICWARERCRGWSALRGVPRRHPATEPEHRAAGVPKRAATLRPRGERSESRDPSSLRPALLRDRARYALEEPTRECPRDALRAL